MDIEEVRELEHQLLSTLSALTGKPILGAVFAYEGSSDAEETVLGVSGIGKFENDYAQIGALRVAQDIVVGRFIMPDKQEDE